MVSGASDTVSVELTSAVTGGIIITVPASVTMEGDSTLWWAVFEEGTTLTDNATLTAVMNVQAAIPTGTVTPTGGTEVPAMLFGSSGVTGVAIGVVPTGMSDHPVIMGNLTTALMVGTKYDVFIVIGTAAEGRLLPKQSITAADSTTAPMPTCDANDATADCDDDSIANDVDNCPAVANTNQMNSDNPDNILGNGDDVGGGDTFGDVCDIDDDNDGLIEIATAVELNNVRNDLDGSHYDTSTDDTAQSNTGCPSGGCNGYELVATIANLSTTYANWVPIGDNTNNFTATFDGNGFGITELVVESNINGVGFFSYVTGAGIVRNLHVAGTITDTGNSGSVGGLVGTNEGLISNCSATVTVTGGSTSISDSIGGLVGYHDGGTIENSSSSGMVTGGADANDTIGGLTGSLIDMGTIRTSWSDATVNGGVVGSSMGGLSGSGGSGLITDSYFTGTITGGSAGEAIGGLSTNSGVTNSYATAALSGGGGSNMLGGLIAGGSSMVTASFHTHIGGANIGTRVTAAELQAPTDAVPGILSAWSTNNWGFGMASQFPALRGYVDSNGDGDNLDENEQGQIMCGQPGQTGTPQTRATRPECVGALVPLPPTR